MHSKSALLILDMQNDLCHPEGVFSKNGLLSNAIQKIVPNIIDITNFCKENNIPIIATQLTILENLQKQAIGLGIYKKIRPFLENEGLRLGSWGHDVLENIPKVDFKIKRWGISSFYQTELAKYLIALNVKELIISGFTTNGVVETTAREAAGRNFKIITLTDCVGSYSESLHQASLTNLNSFGEITTTKDWIETYKNLGNT